MTAVVHAELPLFPLRTVLFPAGLLELKIFEARYLDLMSRCMREQRPFGVIGLKSGGESQMSAEPVALHGAGTLAELMEVDSTQAGILLVRARGTRRFVLESAEQRAEGLWVGQASELPDDETVAPGPAHAGVVQGLVQAIATLAGQGADPFLKPHRFDSAGWVADRWCEILPMPLEAKVHLMAFTGPLERLDVVDAFMNSGSPAH
jgi:Lon protease-like protein